MSVYGWTICTLPIELSTANEQTIAVLLCKIAITAYVISFHFISFQTLDYLPHTSPDGRVQTTVVKVTSFHGDQHIEVALVIQDL